LRYRLWRTSIDAYLTRPLTEEELKDALLLEEFLQLFNEETIGLPGRLERVRQGEEQEGDKLTDLWRKKVKEPPPEDWQKKEYEERIARAKERLEYLLANWDRLLKL